MTSTHLDTAACKVIDTWLDFMSRYGDVPGFQACIRKSGKLIFSHAYGYSNLEKKQKYTTAHLGHIASHSKMFTVSLMFNMQEAGLLHADDLMVKHLPQFKKHKDKRLQEITLRDLATNRAGLFRDGSDCNFWEMERPFPNRKELVDDVMEHNLVYEPNTYTKYSNIGLSLLGLALEVAGKNTYDKLVTKYVLSKLPGTKLLPDYVKGSKLPFAEGHSKWHYNGVRKPYAHPPANALAPATGFCGNMESTTEFLYNLYFTDKIVSKRVRQDLRSMDWSIRNSPGQGYGLGTQVDHINGNTLVGHSGGYPGFGSQTRHLVSSDYIFGFIVNANELVSLRCTRSMAEVILKIKNTFTEAELKDVTVSKPLMNKWGASVYVVGKKKALGFSLGWLLTEEVTLRETRKDGYYYTDTANGYGNIGEPGKFIKRGKDIVGLQSGGVTMYEEKEFMKRNLKGF